MTGNAWSCYTGVSDVVGDALYEDRPGSRYAYDSHVVNHRGITAGDVILIRDKHLVYGHAVVEDVEARPDEKTMLRCPRCRSSRWTSRRVVLPRFRCLADEFEFDEPLVEQKTVTAYTAHYESTWLDFDPPAPVRWLTDVYAGADRQNAIRRLDYGRALALIERFGGAEGQLHLNLLGAGQVPTGGHVDAVVRRRRGQHQFRERLLDRFGAVCAVTGPQPDAVLDAAHLQAFAVHEDHDVSGGLLLRADVHRLFDRLLLTIDTHDWTAQVAPKLVHRHPGLADLDGRPLQVAEHTLPRPDLLDVHRDAARARWRDLREAS